MKNALGILTCLCILNKIGKTLPAADAKAFFLFGVQGVCCLQNIKKACFVILHQKAIIFTG